MASGSNRIKLGELTTTRDFTYVDDTCRGFLAIAGLEDGEIYHIGSGEETSVGNLFKLIGEIMEIDADIEVDSERKRPEQSEVLRLRCNSQKLRDASGFHSKVGLREGLSRTIDWFRDPKNFRRYKEYLYNV
jgi:nucleoside-diphosphate-sugar epimerase